MSQLIAAEWLKLQKRWMLRIIILLMLVIIALVFWGQGTRAEDRLDLLMPRGWLAALLLAGSFAAFLWPILGGNWAGSEYSWGTVRMILSRRPNRTQWVLSALIVLVFATGIALILAMIVGTVAGSIVGFLTGNAIFTTDGLQNDYFFIVVKCFLGVWFVLSFYVLLAYTAGTVFRSGAFGIGFGIGITVAELIIFGIFFSLGGTWKSIAQHFPYAYTNALPQRLAAAGTTPGFIDRGSNVPSVGESMIGLIIYSAILLAITITLVNVRDVTD
jgi:ABC-2 type transport system permease protein